MLLATDKTSTPAKEDSRADRTEIKSRILKCRREFERALMEAGKARSKFAELDRQCSQFETGEQDASRFETIDQEPSVELVAMRKAVECAADEVQAAQKHKDQLAAQIERLEREFHASFGNMDVSVLLAHQAELESLKKDDAQLSRMLDQQQKIVSQSDRASTQLNALRVQRQDLLADAATKEVAPPELKRVNEAIDEAEKASARNQALADEARETILGLERKRNNVTAEIHRLDANTEDLKLDLVLSEAKDLYLDYCIICAEYGDVFSKLVALDQIAQEITNRKARSLLAPDYYEARLPGFHIESDFESSQPDNPKGLFSADYELNRGRFGKARESEVDRFRGLGVRL